MWFRSTQMFFHTIWHKNINSHQRFPAVPEEKYQFPGKDFRSWIFRKIFPGSNVIPGISGTPISPPIWIICKMPKSHLLDMMAASDDDNIVIQEPPADTVQMQLTSKCHLNVILMFNALILMFM